MKFKKETFYYLTGPLIFILILLLFPINESIIEVTREYNVPQYAPKLALATLSWVFIWWVLQPVPLSLTALLPPIIFSISEVLEWEQSLSSFTNPILWIFMAGFVFAVVFKKWGLDQWLVARISTIYSGKNVFIHTLFIAGIPVFILAFTGSITASTAVVYPLLISYLSKLNLKESSSYKEASLLLLAQAASASSMLYLISTAPNLVAKSLIDNYSDKEINFLNWLVIGTPHALLGLFIAALSIYLIVKPDLSETSRILVKEKELAPLKPLTKEQVVILLIMGLTILLWFTPSFLQFFPGLYSTHETSIKNIFSEAMPAILSIFLFGVIKIRSNNLLTWKEMATGIDWGVIFLFGGGIVLGLGLEKSGLAQILAKTISEVMGPNPGEFKVFAIACILGFLLTYTASNTAAAIIACPIAVSLALAAKVPVEPPILGAALACSLSTSLPATTPPMAIIYGSGEVSISRMLKVGLLSDIIRLILLILIGPYLISFIF